MVKRIRIATLLIALTQFSLGADIFRSLGDAEMTNRFKFVFEGYVKSTKTVQENWEEFDGEKVLVWTEFKTLFEASKVIKGDPEEPGLLEVFYFVPSPTIYRGRDRYGPVEKGIFCRLYADNISFDENLSGFVKLKSVGQIRAGTVEERELEAARIAELREKSLLEPVGKLESPKAEDKSHINSNWPKDSAAGRRGSKNPSQQPAKLRSNQSDVAEKNPCSPSWLYWVLGTLILGGVVKLVFNGHKK